MKGKMISKSPPNLKLFNSPPSLQRKSVQIKEPNYDNSDSDSDKDRTNIYDTTSLQVDAKDDNSDHERKDTAISRKASWFTKWTTKYFDEKDEDDDNSKSKKERDSKKKDRKKDKKN